MLPKIRSSSEVYGDGKITCAGGRSRRRQSRRPAGRPRRPDLLQPGEAKNTYGTGCFLLMNTGSKAGPIQFGLLTTLAYKLGKEPAVYALEGSIAITGALVQWVRDNFGLISKSSDIEALARTVEDNGGVYFVPAFSGLYAPYWKANARGVIAGLTRYANKGHIARAVLEATAFQTREVVDAMEKDSGIALDTLRTDGGMVVNESADAVPGRHSRQARGAARRQGNHRSGRCLRRRSGCRLLQEPRRPASPTGPSITPGSRTWTPAKREAEYKQWKKAVTRSFDWVDETPKVEEPEKELAATAK